MKLLDSINVCLFVEDIEEYISINSIKININEDGSPYFHNTSINIECTFNKDVLNKALTSLKYERLIYEYDSTFDYTKGRCYINKKDIVSDIILYVSKINSYYDTTNLLKLFELKNVMITSVNPEENIINLTCDYYIRFNDFLEIEDKEYLENIFRLVNINCNKTYNPPYYLGMGMPFDHTCTKPIENSNDDYEENYDYDWDDYDYEEYQEDNKESEDTFERSSQLISKIFSKFYK